MKIQKIVAPLSLALFALTLVAMPVQAANKNDLVKAMASGANISKSQAEKALNALTKAITTALKKGDKVSIIKFGTFSVSARAARTGRNPQTGATIKIAAKKVTKFKAGKGLSDAVN